ncbi:hypothetical protein [Actinomadura sp. 6K520]|uniref:hypothetical protein n=1 Tax=Actinomadura sp. 6K520 TaxID=2530364 RepID=UPI00104D1787|nr:hypothetical protein [Actinomadura sp. 6K520]TDE33655.1 hypothetical protein E1289_11700 [Actinomadura sp. 6K520]
MQSRARYSSTSHASSGDVRSSAEDADGTVQLAANLHEHVRQLNYATAGPPSLTQPSTAYAILGNLSAAIYGLDQALDQINRFFLRELQAGRLGHDPLSVRLL